MLRNIRLGVHTVSEANKREHWRVGHARHKKQKLAVLLGMLAMDIPKQMPVKITLTRLAKRKLDDDNLQSAFKYIRDAVAEYFIPGKAAGRADDDPGFSWNYDQAKDLELAILLSFEWPEKAEESHL